MSPFFLCVAFAFGITSTIFGLVMLVRLKMFEAAQQRLDSRACEERDATDFSLQARARRPLRVLILHPDLGIGGAERLIIDAALAMQKHQHITPIRVTIVTCHHDAKRAFAETVDGTVTVRVCGNWLPGTIFGKAKIFCVTLRMLWAAFMACFFYKDTDCFVVDQVAAVLPLLHYIAPYSPRLFYSHFPDQCCDSNRDEEGNFKKPPSKLHTMYRRFFDSLEARAMSHADSIVSNSKFSRDITIKTFPQLQSVIDPEKDIFYPPVSWVNKTEPSTKESDSCKEETDSLQNRIQGRTVILSINRYERKKNLSLAIEAFALVISKNLDSLVKPPLLIIAGGYDTRLVENVEHLKELKELALRHKLTDDQVLFLQNISEATKSLLLSQCCCLVYTPTMEHFGIVPTEAMVCAKPVVAVNQGGPCESVGEGGTLCDPTPEAFAAALTTYITDEALAARVGAAGRERAMNLFSMEVFGEKLATRLLTLWTGVNVTLSNEGVEKDRKEKSN
ncbi:glycosyltransferase ALG2 [Trypanosoma theileri]|uniref:Alpha-1,3/1,6-mannosyltransferase ALG2 n=1 Tax=Trypanosoma theileri TaxID=67003 RepID=A0A1X0P9N2_9TRYP|nr:glycosyltransferase ALG2 [Trypanosoma theileri]ORC93634.1 glycosyltransferase ALG2 [Trypanosoma theileri]